MMEDFLSDILFPIVRAGLNISNDMPCGNIDYDLLFKIGKMQDILPIIREGLNALNIEADSRIEQLCKIEIYQFVHRDDAVERISACFNKNAIDFILLKGSVLRDLYPDKWMRTSCDIDVLVKEQDLQRAVDALERETDFRYKSKNYHDVLMNMPNVHLELHFNIKEDMENVDKLLLRVWDNCAKKENTCQFVLTPEFQIFHVISHMSFHFMHGGLGIRSCIDLWLLRHKTEYDESIVKNMCEECGILKFYNECCFLSEVWIGENEHTDTSKMLEKYSMESGVFGNTKNAVLIGQIRHKKEGYIFHRLFMDKERLKRLYPILDKYPFLLPYCQLRRWAEALIKKRDRLKNEINLLNKTSDEEREFYEKLIKSIGM